MTSTFQTSMSVGLHQEVWMIHIHTSLVFAKPITVISMPFDSSQIAVQYWICTHVLTDIQQYKKANNNSIPAHVTHEYTNVGYLYQEYSQMLHNMMKMEAGKENCQFQTESTHSLQGLLLKCLLVHKVSSEDLLLANSDQG